MDYGLKLVFVFIILTSSASATDLGQLSSNTIFNFSAIGVNITILSPQNFSQIQYPTIPTNTLELTINGSNIQFNSTSDKTISLITFTNNIWNFTYTGAGTLKINASVLYKLNYTLYKNGIAQSSFLAALNQVYFDLTSADSYSIQASNTYELYTPLNNSVNVNPISVLFTWSNYPISNPNTIQIATDLTFLNIVSTSQVTSATGEYSAIISLSSNTDYYWHTKNATGSYGYWYHFTTTTPTTVLGQFNITAKDEQTNATINDFSVQLYNSSTVLSKNSTNGWANFTSSEVSSGEYLVRVIPTSQSTSSTTTTTTSNQSGYVVNTSGGNTTYPNISSSSTSTTTITQTSTGYASRSILATSPNTAVTVYLPSSSGNNIIDTLVFNMIDYTNKFSPAQTSYLTVTKNNSVMHSSYFDGGSNVAVYLLRGDVYTLTVNNPAKSNLQQWGNYVSVGSGTIPMVIMDITVNQSVYLPFTTNLTWSNQSIDFGWNDRGGVMSTLTYSIYKTNTTSSPIYYLLTTVKTGQITYAITDQNALYYVFINASTSLGKKEYTQIIDLTGNKIGGSGMPISWGYGSFSSPRWLQTAVATIFLFLLSGTFGALHRGEGSIITGIFSMLFWYWGWLYLGTDDSSSYAAGVFLGSLLLFAILYHLESKRRQGMVY